MPRPDLDAMKKRRAAYSDLIFPNTFGEYLANQEFYANVRDDLDALLAYIEELELQRTSHPKGA